MLMNSAMPRVLQLLSGLLAQPHSPGRDLALIQTCLLFSKMEDEDGVINAYMTAHTVVRLEDALHLLKESGAIEFAAKVIAEANNHFDAQMRSFESSDLYDRMVEDSKTMMALLQAHDSDDDNDLPTIVGNFAPSFEEEPVGSS
jgi:hypothetical protein